MSSIITSMVSATANPKRKLPPWCCKNSNVEYTKVPSNVSR